VDEDDQDFDANNGQGPVSLSVQNRPLALSYVVSTIRADGKVLSKEKAVGPHAMA
jgi:hypothetical protein